MSDKMKHFVEEKTRANVRAIITSIRTRFNLSRKDAEYYFQRAVVDSDVADKLLETVADDLEEQKEYERQYKEMQKSQ